MRLLRLARTHTYTHQDDEDDDTDAIDSVSNALQCCAIRTKIAKLMMTTTTMTRVRGKKETLKIMTYALGGDRNVAAIELHDKCKR